MKGLLIDVHNAKIQEVEVSELDDYYKWIGCENIDITSRKIGGRIYDIICDDEGFFHEPVLVSAVDSEQNAMLVGNLIVVGNSEGDEILHGLSNEELKHLKKNLAVIGVERDEKTTAVYMMLCNVEYL
jgi:hypothetical protein